MRIVNKIIIKLLSTEFEFIIFQIKIMANYKEHAAAGIKAGVIAGISFDLIHQLLEINNNRRSKIDLAELFLSGISGAVVGKACGVLPDILEPAKNPHHRKFFHSILTASAIGYGIYKVNTNEKMPAFPKVTLTAAGMGYLSHLLLDSKTDFGLPLIR
jgi:membrane-bound metal-dependent hydrolase YbcI (DUF457 family)